MTLTDEDMDGEASSAGLATSSGAEWLIGVIDKVGLRLRVHSALKALSNSSLVSQ